MECVHTVVPPSVYAWIDTFDSYNKLLIWLWVTPSCSHRLNDHTRLCWGGLVDIDTSPYELILPAARFNAEIDIQKSTN